jgi:hypothetical protein
MSHRGLVRGLVAAVLVLSAGSALAKSGALRFFAVLSGEQEVPAVESDAKARGLAFFDSAFTKVHVRVDIHGPITVAAAHFHCGRAGTNGPVAFGILNPGPLVEIGQRVRVTLTNENFTGADCIDSVGRPVNNVAALALAMRDGLVYLNLHSPVAPAGEIRGQMLELGR